jgi:hypothetical protein
MAVLQMAVLQMAVRGVVVPRTVARRRGAWLARRMILRELRQFPEMEL